MLFWRKFCSQTRCTKWISYESFEFCFETLNDYKRLENCIKYRQYNIHASFTFKKILNILCSVMPSSQVIAWADKHSEVYTSQHSYRFNIHRPRYKNWVVQGVTAQSFSEHNNCTLCNMLWEHNNSICQLKTTFSLFTLSILYLTET